MRNFSVLLFFLLGITAKNIAQTVTVKSDYTYFTNIDYKLYQSSGVTTTNSVGVIGLILNDAGGDNLPTTLTAITFSISSATGSALRTAALFVNGVKVSTTSTTTPIANGSTSISFSSASLASASDGATVNMELRVTFKTTVIDNQQLSFTVASVTAASSGSSFDAPDGGGATSSVSGSINKIVVTADRYKFGQQPADVFAGQIVLPFVTVKAIDINKNVDSDYVSTVKLNITNPTPSCDTLSGNLVTAVSGTATFPYLTPNVAKDSVTLTATGILSSTISSMFNVLSAQYKTLINWNFKDGNTVADGGTNSDYLTRNISSSGTSAISFGNCGCPGSVGTAAYATGWTTGSGTKFWQIDFYTLGYWNITVSSRQTSTLTGPRDFKVQYKVTNGNWEDLGTVYGIKDTFKFTSSFTLPPIDTPARVYVRWLMNSNTSVSGMAVDDAGRNDIDEITVVGIGVTLAKQLYYRSSGSGDFESSCNWETADNAAGPWLQAKGSPDFSAYSITIQAGHTIAINESINLDELTVEEGATLVLNYGDLHILNGSSISGLNVKGTFIDNSANKDGVTFSAGGTWKLGASATFIKTNNSSAVPYRDKYFSGMSNIPSTANWIIRYTGVSSPSFTADSTFYPNLTFESTNGNWDPGATAGSYFSGTVANGAFTTVRGNLDIGGTGNSGTVKISNVSPNSKPLLIQGNAIIRSGSELNNSVNSTYGTGFEIKGNVTVDGILTANSGGNGLVKLSGSALQTISGAGTINLQNFSVANTGAGVSVTRDLIINGIDSLTQGILDPGINTLTLNGSIIRIAGSINGNANTTALNGTSPQTIPSNTFLNNTIKNLTIGNNVALGGQDTITGTLTLGGSTNKLTTNDYLTLKSAATGTASVAQVNNGNSIIGNVVVERYISARRAWRFLSIPTNTIQTVREAWQEGAASGSGNPVSGHGTQVTNNSGTWSADGFDNFSPDGPSVKKYNQATNAYIGISKTSDLIATKEGLMTFVRGDRTAIGLSATPTNTILRTKGPLYTGPQPAIVITAGKFTSVGNPYAAPLDMRAISKSPGVSDKFYVYDPNLNSLGAFQTFTKIGNDYYPTPGGGSYPSQFVLTPYNLIASGDAFFATADFNGTITFKEDAKGNNDLPLVFRHASVNIAPALLRINMYAIESNGGATLVDGVLVQVDDKFNNNVENSDAIKIANLSENLAIKKDNRLLVVEKRHALNQNDTIQLDIHNMKAKSYKFEIIKNNFTQPGLSAFLEDSYFNTSNQIDLQGNSVFNFNVADVPGSWDPNRFRIVFKASKSGPSLLANSLVEAHQQDKNISVEWKVESEKNIKQYVIEKSINGKQFINQTTITAKNNNSVVANYQWTDIDPVLINNYYRIKSIGLNGEIQYSNVVKVVMDNRNSEISVYPNPVINGVINLRFNNQPKGSYTLKLLNKAGQLIRVKQIEHSEGSSTETIQLNYMIPKGSYQLEVIKPGNNKTNINVLY